MCPTSQDNASLQNEGQFKLLHMRNGGVARWRGVQSDERPYVTIKSEVLEPTISNVRR